MADEAGEGVVRVVGGDPNDLPSDDALLRAIGGAVLRVDADHTVASIGGDLGVLGDGTLHAVAEELVGRPVASLFDAESGQRVDAVLHELGRTGLDVASLLVRVRPDGGEPVGGALRVSTLRSDGEFDGAVCVLRPGAGDRGASDRGTDGPATPAEATGTPLRGSETTPDDLAIPERDLDAVFDRIDDAFYALDDEFRFTYVNERAEELLQRPERALLGERVWDLYPEATETPAWDAFHEALETQEPTSYEVYFDPLEFWVEANVYPSESGLSVYFRDVSERKDREQDLTESERRYRTLVENFPNGAVTMVDSDLRYRTVGGTPLEVAGESPAEVEGHHVEEVLPEPLAGRIREGYESALDGEPATFEIEADGRIYRIRTVPVRDEDGAVEAALGMSQDVTERRRARDRLRENARALQRLYQVSADSDRSFEEKVEQVLALGRERLDLPVGFLAEIDVEDDRFEVVVASGDDDRIYPGATSALSETYCRRTVEAEGTVAVADAPEEGWEDDPAYEVWNLDCYIGGKVEVDGELYGTLCFESGGARQEGFSDFERTFVELATQWISYELERRANERRLERYRSYTDDVLDAIDDHLYVVDEAGYLDRWNRSIVEVTGYTDEEIAEMHGTEFFPEEERAFVAAKIAEVFEEGSARMETEVLTKDGERIPYEYTASALEDPEGDPVLAGIGRDVSERKARERQLEAQRERLAALNSLHQVVGGIADAVIEQSTREEIEATVCDRLADSESYAFAWIGEVDAHADRVRPRRQAGAGSYLDGIEISIDADDEQGQGPTGRAIRSGEVEVATDVLDDPQYEPWREAAREHGFRASAAVPIAHEGTVFGVLNVYADRPDAFAAEERRMLGQLGEIVGHAIAAVERKRVIMGDEVIELEVRVPDVLDAYDLHDPGGTVRFERVVPLADEDNLVYGTATPEARELLEAGADVVPHWTSVEVVREGDGEVAFEVRAAESPLLGAVAERGGAVEEAVLEDGDFYVTVHLPQGADVRSVVETMEERYPRVEPLARRQIERSSDSTRHATLTLLEDLTDRQRTALETAFYAGFYDWPRESSGEDLAEQLDIAPATFAQHLRTAERKLLESVFEEMPASG